MKSCPPTAALAISPPLVMTRVTMPSLMGADLAAPAVMAVALSDAEKEKSPAVNFLNAASVVRMMSSE